MKNLLILSTLSTILLSTSAVAEEMKQNINLGFISTTGNTETFNFNAKYDNKYTTSGYNNQDLSVLFDTRAFMIQNGDIIKNEEYQANLALEQLIYDEWIGYVTASWLTNKFLNFNHKISFGTGVSKELYKDTKQTLTAKLGVGYNIEKYTNLQPDHRFKSLNQYIEYNNQLNKVSNFFLKVGILENIYNLSNDYDAFGSIGFNFAVAENLMVSIEKEVVYNNLPSVGFKKNDSKTIATVGYHF